MGTGQDEDLTLLVNGVLRGDPGAGEVLRRYLLEHRVDVRPLRQRADEGLRRTEEELGDLLRRLRQRQGDNLGVQIDGVLRERAGWWSLFHLLRRVGRGR